MFVNVTPSPDESNEICGPDYINKREDLSHTHHLVVLGHIGRVYVTRTETQFPLVFGKGHPELLPPLTIGSPYLGRIELVCGCEK